MAGEEVGTHPGRRGDMVVSLHRVIESHHGVCDCFHLRPELAAQTGRGRRSRGDISSSFVGRCVMTRSPVLECGERRQGDVWHGHGRGRRFYFLAVIVLGMGSIGWSGSGPGWQKQGSMSMRQSDGVAGWDGQYIPRGSGTWRGSGEGAAAWRRS